MNGGASDWHGALVEAKPILCPSCKCKVDTGLLYFVDTGLYSDAYRELVAPMDPQCDNCGAKLQIRVPIIVYMPERNLTVFATPWGDDGGVDVGFKAYLSKLEPHLPQSVVSAVRRTPYSFVSGREGLAKLLKRMLDHSEPPQRGPVEGSNSFQVMSGYDYGSLFFYMPGQIDVQDIVGQVTAAAGDLAASNQSPAAVDLIERVGSYIGYSHPWLVQEYARLLLETRNSGARTWLERARTSNFCWHAPTISFLDTTPTRRAEGPTQDADVPSTRLEAAYRSLLDHKHTVTAFFPALADAPYWHFPIMTTAAVPQEYTVENLAGACAVALGTFERRLHERKFEVMHEATQVGWWALQEKGIALVSHLDGRAELFWNVYLDSRWPCLSRVDGARSLTTEVISEIDDLLQELSRAEMEAGVPADADDPFIAFRLGFSPKRCRYYLEFARRVLIDK